MVTYAQLQALGAPVSVPKPEPRRTGVEALADLPSVKVVPRSAFGELQQKPERYTWQQLQASERYVPIPGVIQPEPAESPTVGESLLELQGPQFRQQIGGIMRTLGEMGKAGPAGFWSFVARQPLDQDTGQTLTKFGERMYGEATKEIQEKYPDLEPGTAKSYAFEIANATSQMIPMLALSVTTGSPMAGLTFMGGQVWGQRYGESREAGRTPREATQDAAFYTLAETIPERIPLGILMRPGGKFLGRTLKAGGAEGIQEIFTEALEAGYSAGVLNEEMTWGEAWQNMTDAGIVGAGAGALLAAVSHPFTRRAPGPAERPPPEVEPAPAAPEPPPTPEAATAPNIEAEMERVLPGLGERAYDLGVPEPEISEAEAVAAGPPVPLAQEVIPPRRVSRETAPSERRTYAELQQMERLALPAPAMQPPAPQRPPPVPEFRPPAPPFPVRRPEPAAALPAPARPPRVTPQVAEVPGGGTRYTLPSFVTRPHAKPKPAPAVTTAETPQAVPKRPAVVPKQKRPAGPRREPSDWTEIGKNAIGQTLYEDQRGVRSYVENGVRRTEPVGISPRGEISVRREDDRYKLASEAEPAAPPPPAAEAPIPPERRPIRPALTQEERDELLRRTNEAMPEGYRLERPKGDLPGQERMAVLHGPGKPAITVVPITPETMDNMIEAARRHAAADRSLSQRLRAGSVKLSEAVRAINPRAEPGTVEHKAAEEQIEAVLVETAREIVREGLSPGETFDELLRLQNNAPTLQTRTSGSMQRQAYSTPIAIAYAASRLAGASRPNTDALEPAAGNGALLIERDRQGTPLRHGTVVNEIDPARADNLKRQFGSATKLDATTTDFGTGYDVILANPPFGALILSEEAGRAEWTITAPDGTPLYETGEIDHAIVWNALRSLAPDGSAVLLLAGPSPQALQATGEEHRRRPYMSGAKQKFYYALYDHFNVTDHITLEGSLYRKQGAGWPIDIVVIQGRGKSARPLPARQLPRVISSWDEVKELAVYGGPTVERPGVVPGGREPAPGGRGVQPAGVSTVPGYEPVPPPPREPSEVDVGERRPERPAPGQRPVAPARPAPRAGAVSGRPGRGGAVRRPGPAVARPGREPAAEGPPREPRVPEGGRPAGVGVEPGREGRRRAAPAAPVVETELQKAYEPASATAAIGTLTPTNLVTPTEQSLARLSAEHGSVDAFIRNEMGWSENQLAQYLAAEQIDALALALDKLKRGGGFVIGDQTGVGKGRVNAAIIQWAKKNGMVPVFFTEKPNLYSDIMRDLEDTGAKDFKPFVTNAGLTGKNAIPLPDGTLLTTAGPAAHDREMARIGPALRDTGKLKDYDAIFTTYAQAQTVKGALKYRHQLLGAAMPNAILILDESHNAGGVVKEQRGKKEPPPDRAKLVRDWVAASRGTFYSSATYAKRPDVMSLYAKTSLGRLPGGPKAVENMFSKGGLGLQQVASSMLAEAGEYIRRERSFEGVDFDGEIFPTNLQYAEQASEAMREIVDFQNTFIKGKVSDIGEELAGEGQAGQGAELSVSSTNFTAIMHNVIDQMLLASKADATVQRALTSIEADEKPVIAVANTMGSILDEILEQTGTKIGQRVDFRFNHLLARYLERTRWYTKSAGPYSKEKERVYITDEELGPEGTRIFNAISEAIMAMDFGGMPGSPIDYIRSELSRAGYKVGELTGRNLTVDYADGGRVKARPSAEKSKAGVVRQISAFNNGELDAIVLNQSGATGLSLHASEKFKDQRRRRMIIAQPEKNIDTFMQMLGRVHRTGQVVSPAYTLGLADMPAEKRPGAVLMKKLKSLNANTTASAESELDFDLPDFMDEVGDKVAALLLRDNPEIDARLGFPLRPPPDEEEGRERREVSPKGGENIRKMTGRIPLLPVQQQEEVYAALIEAYNDEIARMRALGENVGAAETLDLDAQFIERTRIAQGEGEGPFGEPAYMTKASVKRQGRSMTRDEVLAELGKTIGIDPTTVNQHAVLTRGREMTKQLADTVDAEFEQYREARLGIYEDPAARQREAERLTAQRIRVGQFLRDLPIGQPVYMRTEDGNYYGLVTNLRVAPSSGSPMAPNRWKATIAVADPMRQIMVTASNWDDSGIGWDTQLGLESALRNFDQQLQTASREERFIITGNIPAGFSAMDNKGKVVFFTDASGATKSGVLMPRTFQAGEQVFARPVQISDPEHVLEFIDRAFANVHGPDELLVYPSSGGLIGIEVPSSKAKGGRIFLNPDVLDALNDEFVKSGNRMKVRVSKDRAREALKEIIKLVGPLEVRDDQKKTLAYEITGQERPVVEQATDGKFEGEQPTPEQPGAAPPGGQTELYAGIPINKVWDWWLGPFFQKYWEPFGRLPFRQEYITGRRLAQGDIDQLGDFTREKVYESLRKHPPSVQIELLKFLTTAGASPTMISDPEARKDAATIKKMINRLAKELVYYGVLTPAQEKLYRDRYLPQLYLKYLLQESAVALGRGARPRVSSAQMGATKRRRLTKEAARKFGKGGVDFSFLDADEMAQFNAFSPLARPMVRTFLETPDADVDVELAGQPRAVRQQAQQLKDQILLRYYQEIVLGQVKDPAYLAARAFGTAAHTIAVMRFLDKIALGPNRGWIYPKSMVRWNGRNWSARYLMAEAQRLRADVEFWPENQRDLVRRAADDMEAAARTGAQATPDEPKLYRQIPDSKRYGMMRGLWVRREIHDDLVGQLSPDYHDETINWLAGIYRGTLVPWWKASVTALSPAGQARNHVGGGMQAQVFGMVPIHEVIRRYLETWRQIINNGPWWQAMKRRGGRSTSFAQAELMKIHDEFLLKVRHDTHSKNPIRLTGDFFYRALMRGAIKAGDAYSMNEQFWKTLVLGYHMDKGVPEAEAAEIAHAAIFDYSMVHPWLRWYRENVIIGSPFATFTYRAIPKTLEAMFTRPQAFLPYVGVLAALYALTAYYQDLDDEEMAALRALLPWWNRGFQTVILPWKDQHDRFQAIDLGWMFPFGGVMKALEAIFTEGDVAKMLDEIGFASNPVSQTFASLARNRDQLGREVWSPDEPTLDQAMDIMAFVGSQFAPTLGRQVFGLMDAIRAIPNRWGDPQRTPGQAAARMIGVTVHPMDVRLELQRGAWQRYSKIRAAQERYREIAMDEALKARSPSGYRAQLERQARFIRELQEDYQRWIDRTAPAKPIAREIRREQRAKAIEMQGRTMAFPQREEAPR